MKSDIGIIGLAVMGQNLARNFANKGFKVMTYNRSTEKAKNFIKEFGNEHLDYKETVEDVVQSLEKPRKLLLMVKAGAAVDAVIEQLTPLLDSGDIIIDGGNSNFKDSIRRSKDLEEKGIQFVGMGVSGGEEGALNGPSLMPGGSKESWKILKSMLEKIAARDFSDGPCVTHIGTGGAGHYVKMVHNGIEYGVMQLMAEAYQILKQAYDLPTNEISETFKQLSEGPLKSFLFDISVPILKKEDNLHHCNQLVECILDTAGQKGTGRWTGIDALKRGVSLPTITMAVFARNISARKELRMELSEDYEKKETKPAIPLEEFVGILEKALYAAMISCYAQGFDLLQVAAKEEKWDLDFAEISRIWEGGCIIRANLLNVLHQAFQKADGNTPHLFSVPDIQKTLKANHKAWHTLINIGVQHDVSIPAIVTSLTYFEDLTSAQLPANFIQGLRDYFGAHTYKRTDRKGTFHTEWGEL